MKKKRKEKPLNADNLEVFCIIFATELNHICHTHLALGYIFLLQSYIIVKASDQNNNMEYTWQMLKWHRSD